MGEEIHNIFWTLSETIIFFLNTRRVPEAVPDEIKMVSRTFFGNDSFKGGRLSLFSNGILKDHFKGGEEQFKKITQWLQHSFKIWENIWRKPANKSRFHRGKPKAITQGNHVCKQQDLGSIVQFI